VRLPPASRRARVLVGVAGLTAIGIVAASVLLANQGSPTPTSAAGPPQFIDEAAAAGINHTYDGEFSYSVGGGLAVLDCNADGRPDLYLAGGANPSALYRNDSPVGGALRFIAINDPAVDLTNATGAYPIDIDGDGQVDLAVLRVGETVLLRGTGDCHFERANERWGFAMEPSWGSAFAATWEGTAALPTLALGSYLTLTDAADGSRACVPNALYRPNPAGSGYAAPLPLTPGYCALSMLFSDWARSGRRDLRISNDRHYYDRLTGGEQLWRMTAGAPPRLYAESEGWVQVQVEGMGIASQDLTGDGYPEVYLTSQGASRLQTLTEGPSQPTYGDIGLKRGVNVQYPFAGGDVLPSTAWHPEFEDVNNDGFVDLFVSKGNVADQADYATKDPSNLLLGQPDGTFTEAADRAGILNFGRGRGAALADFNLDGALDLVEMNYGAPVRLWRNVGPGGNAGPAAMDHWIAVRLAEPRPNLDAIGSWLEVQVGSKTIEREVVVGGGHASGQLGWIHIGLGPAATARVRVQWPDGQVGPWLRVDADHFYGVDRAAGTAVRWEPPAR
jgi:hypothetical protein